MREDVLQEGTRAGIFAGQTPETCQKMSVAESSLKPIYKQPSFRGRGSPGNKLVGSLVEYGIFLLQGIGTAQELM